ncbi:hypothetical protein RvY_17754 [Ramazzottius varieornatus]|uniref:BTB domain-containing protein n=1 Tax=Ramazzottius varieornatus TaxID=947166 RepID=A0A1D1W389_RAMVA|nr:hypothetical protein RvY_17754 [Ramazzottius varieornatus]
MGRNPLTARRVHKAVRNTASPVFERMLESDLDTLFKYIYYGVLDFPEPRDEVISGIMRAADKYELFDLKSTMKRCCVAEFAPIKAAIRYLAANCAQSLLHGKYSQLYRGAHLTLITEVDAAVQSRLPRKRSIDEVDNALQCDLDPEVDES